MSLIGIDLGTRKAAVAVFTDTERGRELAMAYAHEVPAGVTRPHQLAALAGWVHDMCVLHEADTVFIEAVIVGNNHKYSLALAEVKGAILAALARLPVVLQMVDNKTWKKQMVGNGNATKDMVRNYILATHPDYAPICGDDQDCYDACCIGLYGLRLVARAADLTLTEPDPE